MTMLSSLEEILHSIESGDPNARANLIQVAYDDLRRLAGGRIPGLVGTAFSIFQYELYFDVGVHCATYHRWALHL